MLLPSHVTELDDGKTLIILRMFAKLMFTTTSGAAYDSVAAPRALTTIARVGIVT